VLDPLKILYSLDLKKVDLVIETIKEKIQRRNPVIQRNES